MKEGWEVRTLGEIAQIKGGKRVPKGYKLEANPTNYPYIRVTDFNDDGSVDLHDIHYVSKSVYEQIKSYTISANDLYISIAGTIGKTGIVPKVLDGANLTENACKLIFKETIEPKFIYYFTKSIDFLNQAGLNTRVTAMPKLALSRLATIKLQIPNSRCEQQRIVAILDETFEALARAKENAARNLQNARELFESVLQGVFANPGEGWKENKLGNITKKIGSGATPLGGENSYHAEGISLIRSLNVYDMGFKLKNLAFINDEQANKLSNVVVELGDVLLNITGASVARCCIVPGEVLPARVNQHVSIIRLEKDEMFPEFLHYALISKEYKDMLLKTGEKGGSTRQAITKAQIEGFSIRYPTLNEQYSIITRLDALSAETKKLEALYQQKLADLEELKKSILQKAFEGEL